MTNRRPGPNASLWLTGLLVAGCIGSGCSRSSGQPQEQVSSRSQAVISNGDFESGDFTGWTVTAYQNKTGVNFTAPISRSSLQLTPGAGNLISTVLMANTEQGLDWVVDYGGGSFLYPKYHTHAGVVNYTVQGDYTNWKYNANSISQTMTVATGDIDPVDGRIHVRLAFGPILDPGLHQASDQPFVFFGATNTTRSINLYGAVRYATEPGVPWKRDSNNIAYSDWQLIDISPSPADLLPGEQVNVEVIASGCDKGDHAGYSYVDGVAAFVPGISVESSAPTSINAGDNLAYSYVYRNSGTEAPTNCTVAATLPGNTTFVSVNAPGATAPCSTPAVGGTGTVTCNFGTLNPNSYGFFTITTNVAPSATGQIIHGNYEIYAGSLGPLLGPFVTTTVTTAQVYADLAVTKTDGQSVVGWGQPVAYDIFATNNGPSAVSGAHMLDPVGALLTGASWSCTATAGGSCTASGSGNIDDSLVNLPAGATAHYTLNATVVSGTGTGQLVNAVSISAPSGIMDNVPANNVAADIDDIGTAYALAVSKTGVGQYSSSVVSTPPSISCGSGCTSASASFLAGSTVMLFASSPASGAFAGWSGDCSGTGPCTLVMGGAKNVTASFTSTLKDLGVSCGAASECASNNCVDTVCCENSCQGQCSGCNETSHAGHCIAVQGSPRTPRAACTTDGTTCAGTCGGTQLDTCTYPGSETGCRAASCAANVQTLAANCAGTGNCPQIQTQPCSPYVCGATQCLTTCNGDAQCIDNTYCDTTNHCAAKKPDGQQCGGTNECANGHCTDGYCCNSDCTGQCQACDVSGYVGVCTPVSGSPHGSRPACAASGTVCDGRCDGTQTATCTYPGTETNCRAGTCVAGLQVYPANCDSAGHCPPEVDKYCTPYVCDTTVCKTSCGADNDCDASNYYCQAPNCVSRKTNGQPCSGGNQCQSSHCADSVCCNAVCNGQCEACNESGNAGSCIAVIGTPRVPRSACTTDGTACAGKCDGTTRPVCTYPGGSTQCRAKSCTSNVETMSANCAGTGNCPQIQTQPCNPYVCGTDQCLVSCTSGAQCLDNTYCDTSNHCSAKKSDGEQCSGTNQCANGHCTDGYCCNSDCTGQCQACDVSGHLGVCTPVSGAPHSQRTACTGTGTVCAGNCDGSNANVCAYPGTGTNCRAASCSSGQQIMAADCDGTGHCSPEVAKLCAPYVCGSNVCKTTCAGDTDCNSSNYCQAPNCIARKSNGLSCDADNQCTSEHCTDSVCCNAVCSGQCEACDEVNHAGQCIAVTGSPRGQRTSCFSDGTACGGACNGTTRPVCTYPGGSTECRAPSCTSNVATLQEFCANTGSCPQIRTQACSPYSCGPKQCNGNCTTDEECDSTSYCSAGVCKAKQADGNTCETDSQCVNNHCVDSVCCNIICIGQCQACAEPGHAGTCTTVSGYPRGMRPTCVSDGTVCGGNCDGVHGSLCTYVGDTVQCRVASCAQGQAILEAYCHNTGLCPPEQIQQCTPYQCGADKCLGDCQIDENCDSGHYCSGGVCVPKLVNGSPCAGKNQCASSMCVDDVCCNSDCTGQCEACDVSGSAGSCTAVQGAPHGARQACKADGSVCSGTCDGTIRQNCSYPSNSQSCRDPSCTGGIATLQAWCTGEGTCPPETHQDCAPYICGPNQCNGNCITDDDCTAANFCSGGVCEPRRQNGAVCQADNQCTSASCVDGYCCNSGCYGQCEACDVDGLLGTCSPVLGLPHGPRVPCSTDGTACGGSCDGTDTWLCQYPGSSVQCRAPECTNNVAVLPASCDSQGACPPKQTQDCTPYSCGTNQCLGNCTIDGDCAPGNYCSAGVCQPKNANGTPCSGHNQCTSDYCVDDVCCNAACTGQCEACNSAGSVGTCHPVVGPPGPGRQPCASDGTVCAGACDGTTPATCSYPSNTVICRTATCTNDIAVLQAGCNSQGACPEKQVKECTPFHCGSTQCLGNCVIDTDCISTAYCSAGVCTNKAATGTSCIADNQCISSHCADAVCCGTACAGQCQACAEPGNIGTCSVVSGTPRSPRQNCNGAGVCAGTCSGNVPGCVFPDQTVVCAQAACADGVSTQAAMCDNTGSCNKPVSTSCYPYLCNGAKCATSCSDSSQCSLGGVCAGGRCAPPPASDAGSDAPSDAGPAPSPSGAGCGCRESFGATKPGSGVMLGLVAISLLLARRRRDQRGAGASPGRTKPDRATLPPCVRPG